MNGEGAAPVGVGAAEPTASTGDPAVDAAVQAVAAAVAAGDAPGEQLHGYEAAHQALRDALARIDQS